MKVMVPHVVGDETDRRRLECIAKDLKGFGDLDRSDDMRDRSNHTDRVTSWRSAGRGQTAQHAAQAGRPLGQDWQDETVASHCRSIDPASRMFCARVVEYEAGF